MATSSTVAADGGVPVSDKCASAPVTSTAHEAVLIQSIPVAEGTPTVCGYDFDAFDESGAQYSHLLRSLRFGGFQASNFGMAVDRINDMLRWRLSDDPIRDDEDDEFKDMDVRKNTQCTIFLGYTSNLISAGTRESFRFLAKHKLVSCIVTTAGGIEEDFIKCLAPTYMGSFHLSGQALRRKGQNRIGNLIVPNDNYCQFERFLNPILDAMVEEQERDGVNWTPSKMIARLGREINDERSVYYWCAKNDIPVFCPALTDGSIGDMLFFHTYRAETPLRLDIVDDVRSINSMALHAKKTGMVILGGGLVKHHICNANLMKNGADFAVFVNTGQEFDGSDAGASPDEAVSWGKIALHASPVKVCADASLVFPLLMAETFAKYKRAQDKKEDTTDESS